MKKGSKVKIVSTQKNSGPWKNIHWGYRLTEERGLVKISFKNGDICEVAKARGVKPNLFGNGPETGYLELICNDEKTAFVLKKDVEEIK